MHGGAAAAAHGESQGGAVPHMGGRQGLGGRGHCVRGWRGLTGIPLVCLAAACRALDFGEHWKEDAAAQHTETFVVSGLGCNPGQPRGPPGAVCVGC